MLSSLFSYRVYGSTSQLCTSVSDNMQGRYGMPIAILIETAGDSGIKDWLESYSNISNNLIGSHRLH